MPFVVMPFVVMPFVVMPFVVMPFGGEHQHLKVISVVFTLALIFFEIPTFRNVNFIKAGQCHRVEHAPMQISTSKKVIFRVSGDMNVSYV